MLLLVEDEANLAKSILFHLNKAQYVTKHIADGNLAYRDIIQSRHGYDLIILDVMLPGRSGLEICKAIRAHHIATPILFLSALAETSNKVTGLSEGADDYLGKPFHAAELLARVSSLLRRQAWSEQKTVVQSTPLNFTLALDQLCIFANAHSQHKINLTPIEAKLIDFFAQNVNKVLTRSDILEQVWGLSRETQTRTLDNFIVRVRDILKELKLVSTNIESVRGVGYRLTLTSTN